MVHLVDILPFTFSNSDIKSLFISENIFFISVAIIWMIIASIQDFKKREVENWWNLSMIFFVLAFKAFLSIGRWNYMYFAWGLIGLAAGFIVAGILYYARLFAVGDAKLLIALMGIVPLSLNWRLNITLMLGLLILILIVGAIYGAVYSLILVILNCRQFGEEFARVFKKNATILLAVELFCLLALICFLIFQLYLAAGIIMLVILAPVLLVYGKAIENSCMNEFVDVKNLTIGDWIVKPVKITGGKIIKPNWEGLNEEQLNAIQADCRGQRVLVKQGIPFVPVFLMAFIALLILI